MADTNPRDLIHGLAQSVEILLDMRSADAKPMRITEKRLEEARAYLAQPEPTLTVEDCSNMDKHWSNFLHEDRPGEITLDGSFTREDLIEIANTVPSTEA